MPEQEVCETLSTSGPGYGEGRDAIVQAAIQLVARDGLTKLTHRSLAAEAGVGRGTVMYHFAGIDDVVREALQRCLEISVGSLRTSGSLEEFFEPIIETLRDHPELQAFQADVVLEARRRPELQAAVREHQASYREYLETTLRDLDVAPGEDLVQLMLAAADGMIYQRIAFGAEQSANVERQVQGLRRLLSDHLAVRRLDAHSHS